MEKKVNSQKERKIYVNHKGEQFITVPKEGEPNAWRIVPLKPEIKLTEQEVLKANALGYKLDMVLKVKELLSQNLSITSIHKKTGFSRSTITNYNKNVLSNSIKIHGKSTKNTLYFKSVFPMLLTVSESGVNNTPVYYFLIILLPLVVAIVWIRYSYQKFCLKRASHKKEVNKLHADLAKAMNYSYMRNHIICNSKVERIYYEGVLTHYNNQGRDIVVVERLPSETSQDHYIRKEEIAQSLFVANRHEIEQAAELYSQEWDVLRAIGLLDYLHYPLGENWRESKQFIEETIQYLVDNPRPNYNDRARKKYVQEKANEYRSKTALGISA